MFISIAKLGGAGTIGPVDSLDLIGKTLGNPIVVLYGGIRLCLVNLQSDWRHLQPGSLTAIFALETLGSKKGRRIVFQSHHFSGAIFCE